MTKKRQRRPKHVPQRSCIACRRKTDKRQLTRIVRSVDAGVVVDLTGKQNGRGAYICNQPECWDKILKTRLLEQALMTEVTEAEKEAIYACKPVNVEVA